ATPAIAQSPPRRGAAQEDVGGTHREMCMGGNGLCFGARGPLLSRSDQSTATLPLGGLMRLKLPALVVAFAAVLSAVSGAALPAPPSLLPAPSGAKAGVAVATFLPNAGQIRGRARFYVTSGNSAVYFEPDAVVLRPSRAASGAEPGVLVKVDFPRAPRSP